MDQRTYERMPTKMSAMMWKMMAGTRMAARLLSRAYGEFGSMVGAAAGVVVVVVVLEPISSFDLRKRKLAVGRMYMLAVDDAGV
jgi:hypothetical protein